MWGLQDNAVIKKHISNIEKSQNSMELIVVFYSFLVFGGKLTTSTSTFSTPISQLLRIFPGK